MSCLDFFDGDEVVAIKDQKFVLDRGVYATAGSQHSEKQQQTETTFGFKWEKEDTFDSEQSLKRVRRWLFERYQEPQKWLDTLASDAPISVLDAGCGAGMSGFEYFSENLKDLNYLGVDISDAIYVAAKRGKERMFKNVAFLKASVDTMPALKPSFDIIFSEGVLHHTDSTKNAFDHLCQLLKQNGLFMFYIYRKKGPIREFTDDYVREALQAMPPEAAWKSLEPLTQLGITLGELDIEVDVPDAIDLLGIPAGKINLQRLFYWHIFKAFYDPNLTFDEMHHINFDWYAPQNAHRHTVDEVQAWCDENGLEIEHMREELAGITCIARKK